MASHGGTTRRGRARRFGGTGARAYNRHVRRAGPVGAATRLGAAPRRCCGWSRATGAHGRGRRVTAPGVERKAGERGATAVAGGLRCWRLPLLGGAIAAVLMLLMVTAIRAATTYYYTLPQFRALGPAGVGRYVQVNGVVAPGVRWDPATQVLRFDVLPPAGAGGAVSAVRPLPVVFTGPEPDAFTAGISVVVAGRLQPDGTFAARQVLVKCPSHYTAAPPGSSGATWPTA